MSGRVYTHIIVHYINLSLVLYKSLYVHLIKFIYFDLLGERFELG